MIPGLVHFYTFQSLGDFFDARDMLVDFINARSYGFISHHPKGFEGTNCLRDSLLDIFYDHDGDGRETTPYYGVIEADYILREAIKHLNMAKQDFKKNLTNLSAIDVNSQKEILKRIKNPGEWPTRLQRYAVNLGRLNINHVYRSYPIMSVRPEKIQQSWSAHGKSIKRISKKEAIERILAFGYPLEDHLEIQYKALSSLPDSTQLAVVRDQTPHIKTNVFFRGKEAPTTFKTKLPIIIPGGSEDVFIDFIDEPKLKTMKHQSKRRDILIDENPVASSIHVYRYRESYGSK